MDGIGIEMTEGYDAIKGRQCEKLSVFFIKLFLEAFLKHKWTKKTFEVRIVTNMEIFLTDSFVKFCISTIIPVKMLPKGSRLNTK